ncbi:MAG: hypothetical protein AAB268_09245 [Elusimicrobiota bacterium]
MPIATFVSMKTLSIGLATALTLAGILPAAAQLQTSASQIRLNIWAGPLGSAFRSYGTSRIPELGTRSLAYFAESLGLQALREAPESLVLLANSLEAAGATPEAFALMPLAEQMSVVKHAALAAEAEANRQIETLLSDYGGRKHEVDALKMEHALAAALRVQGPYLQRDLRQGVSDAMVRVEDLRNKHYEAWRVFSQELRGKIASGFFTGRNTFAKVDGGWMIADDSPVDVQPTLAAAFTVRIDDVDRSAPGTWSEEALGVLDETLKRADILEALKAEGGESAVGQARAMVQEAWTRHRTRLRQPREPKLESALSKIGDLSPLPPSPKDVALVARHYNEILKKTLPKAIQFRAEAELRTSLKPYPRYPSRQMLLLVAARGRNAASRWAAVGSAATVAAAAFSLGGAPLIWALLPLLAGVSILIYAQMRVSAWKRAARNLSYDTERESHLAGRWPDGHYGGPNSRS